ncbi:MAG: Smr/MutS family protein, partial [Clostridium sp.]|nr:Smr/MutS family protein [Clostridium sp.]
AEKFRSDYEKKLNSLNSTREKALHEGRKEAREIIEDAKSEADKILKNIRELERMGYSSSARAELEKERKKLKNKLESTQESSFNRENDKDGLKKVNEGEEVYISSLNMNGIVISKPDNKGEVQIQAGIMKISVKLADLRKVKQDAKSSKKAIKKREAKLNLRQVSSSVDLRGMDAEEAVYVTDKYLDDAYMSGLAAVTVIHGKGTGILRDAITNMLKGNKHVKSYRLGNYGEGGTGVTIVELK